MRNFGSYFRDSAISPHRAVEGLERSGLVARGKSAATESRHTHALTSRGACTCEMSLRDRGIKVATVCSGATDTELAQLANVSGAALAQWRS
jgi:hypothetical protein